MRLNKKFLKKFTEVDSKIVVHCKTREEANVFCTWMHDNELRWSTGDIYLYKTDWNTYKECTCYRGNGLFSGMESYESMGRNIIRLSDLTKPKKGYTLDAKFLERFLSKTKRKIAVQCDTYGEAKKFCEWMHESGLKWVNGSSYAIATNWEVYSGNVSYTGSGTQCNSEYFIGRAVDWKVIKFSKLVKPVKPTKPFKPTIPVDFTNANVGDKVWNNRNGWGKITYIDSSDAYQISAEFTDRDGDCEHRTFTYKGLHMKSDNLPSLFWEARY